ncbi:amino acid transporter [Thermaerobacter marianensis DSM 12885]|uniref:Amino acid transporter n=1 Tax=Thermaerobacter marianensis (strain ATCC 700841 / DSM 12885 / JCM 10246 / 7p75a) TaxID=644966 RepID=E6SIU4_THEM7|nr:APC family permease [Thermaerobacter marianensis]ADU50939.1 amino acid transporter [Thermaerobacter marianensis DSM 12885]
MAKPTTHGWRAPAPVLIRRVKRVLLGRPKRTDEALHERLPVPIGLAVFFSDALSSVAYGPEEVLYVLMAAGTAGLPYALPIGLAIVTLIFLVSASYTQTIRAYPGGGGAYTVARDNLGEVPGLVAAAALLSDYLLTVAVSVAAGVGALTSAVPALRGHETGLGVLAVLFITWMNLRGVRESGTVFAIPVYGFILTMAGLVGAGLVHLARGGWHPAVEPAQGFAWGQLPWVGPGLSVFLLLRAFASGTATLTGLEAVANGVRAFRPPEAENAARTMVLGRTLLAVLFAGLMVLATGLHALPREGETLLSHLARAIFGSGILYYAVQAATMLILFLAANTAFADFPRLLAILARDGYVSRRFGNLGDTLVHSLGIGLLAAASSLLLVLFRGSTHRLIPLYAVGVFTAFTLSQAGMVVHWLREWRGPRSGQTSRDQRDERDADAGGRMAGGTSAAGGANRTGATGSTGRDEQRHGEAGHAAGTGGAGRTPAARPGAATRGGGRGSLRLLGPLLINGLGAVACAVVLAIVVVTKFTLGGWVAVVIIPLLVLYFLSVRNYYNRFLRCVAALDEDRMRIDTAGRIQVVLAVGALNAVIRHAARVARRLGHDVVAVHVATDPDYGRRLLREWRPERVHGIPLEVLESPYRDVVGPLRAYLDRRLAERPGTVINLLVPVIVTNDPFDAYLHNGTAYQILRELVYSEGVLITVIPFYVDLVENGKMAVHG